MPDYNSELIHVSTIENGIVEVAIARPAVRNALNEATALALNKALAAVADNDQIRCAILHGKGSSFCAGADLAEFEKASSQPASERLETLFLPALRLLMTMEKPVIAAINGAAAGIGVSYVLASDMVVMGCSAYLKLAFINIGLIPDGGACWHLVRQLGHTQAFEMAALATPISAAHCLSLGLANRVVDDERVLEEARDLAHTLVTQSPQALSATKYALRKAAQHTLNDTMILEGELQDQCKASEDFQSRVAAFRQRRRN
ncbi:enoyl-CoA hydratase/isomerase family protein [Vreelandella olivaria]|uniref:enoyl-CoA hydratase/isomerase family protein n=1 Tax=Vreelandella olivaria TaxID=390919 RepID=UPI00201F2FE6|nr:enoyl-CoA hydratase/isomerase family protein [Halomonas olivaria]